MPLESSTLLEIHEGQNVKRILAALTVVLVSSLPSRAAEFELKDGDKVIFLGSTLIEREQRYGYWEAMLTARWPQRNITFRNLGWSGDNVFGEARLAFEVGHPTLGLKRMVDLALAEKPTVIFICYGTNESFEGEAGLPKFEKGMEKLLDELKPANARIALMTPTPFEKSARSQLDPKEGNRRLALYCDAIAKIAARRSLSLVDLFHALPESQSPGLTDNGIHLTQLGYEKTMRALAKALQWPDTLSDGPVGGIANGEQLRQAIIEKNRLYFYRWRPQNETYLFGFRKHEQGRNAKEVAEFDPLTAKAEEEIARLRSPKK